jgi:hypothetical protein
VAFPNIPGAFGTLDLLVRINRVIHIIDLKFGVAVRVLALYPDGDEDVFNSQLMFYAAAARHSRREFFGCIEDIVLTIVQPVSIEPDAEMVSSVKVTHAELDEFIAVYRAACAEALSPAPRLKRGGWCRFCPAKPICPAHTGPLLDLGQFVAPTLRDTLQAVLSTPARDAYLKALAAGLDLADAVRDIRTALHDQAKAALENGDVVPGYALTEGRATRCWRNSEHTTIAALESIGLKRDDVVAEELRSPKQVETRAKARGLKVPPELIVSTRSGVALARAENAHLPVRGREEIVRSLSAALKAVQGGRQS